MVAVLYTSINGTYSIRDCNIDDVPKDLEEVKRQLSVIGESLSDETEYVDRMTLAVGSGVARCVELNGVKIGFVYLNVDGDIANACSIAMYTTDTVGLVLLMLKSKLGKYKEIRVYPHGNNFQLFRSLINKRSIYYYHIGVYPYVAIRYGKHRVRTYVNTLKRFNVKKVAA